MKFTDAAIRISDVVNSCNNCGQIEMAETYCRRLINYEFSTPGCGDSPSIAINYYDTRCELHKFLKLQQRRREIELKC